MKFEEFKKEYEDVFTNKRNLKKCKLDLISTDTGMDVNTYIMKMNELFSEFQMFQFDYLVKIAWMFRRYCYRDRRRKGLGPNGIELDGSFAVFMRRYIGYDAKIIRNFVNYKLIGYLDDFFPDFDINNPFEVKYEYPYKYVNFEMLMLVHNIPERLELLKIAEERKMGYTEFLDYIINYINCYNDKHGPVYEFFFSSLCVPYVKKYEGKEIQTSDIP